MTILYPAPAAVKSPRRMFALGLARPNRERVARFTAADREWAAQALNVECRDFEVIALGTAELDRLAAESAALEAYAAGLSFA